MITTGTKKGGFRQIGNKHIFRAFIFSMLAVYTAFLLSVLFFSLFLSDYKTVVINEICSNNFSLIRDNTGQYSDYIELYNPNDATVSLDGFFLSDDENQLQKISLDTVSIPPGGYYVVWLTKNTGVTESEQGSGFGISKAGETIYLFDNNGEILDSVTVPALSYNTCYGRVIDGGTEWARMSDTAGRSNLDAEKLPEVSLPAPVFSVESGFYREPFEVDITAPEGSTIYYTLDGSNPTCNSYIYNTPLIIEDASQKENVLIARTDLRPQEYQYTPSFPVDKATILRAVCYDSRNDTVSKVVTKVYFVGYDDREEYDNFPIISIVTDPDNLFDAETGIYGNGIVFEKYKKEGGMQDGELMDSYTDQEGKKHRLYEASNAVNEGREWERESTISYFDNLHELCFEQNIGIRIAGEFSRVFRQKSVSIYGRDIYEQSIRLPYEFFPNTSYSSVKLRNGGDNNERAMITDAFLEELVMGRNVSIQRSTPCIVFLNGEYWGIYNIRERYKEEYFSNHYGVRGNNIWVMDGDSASIGDSEAQNAYEFMIELVKECDLSFDDVYDMICENIDVQSFIDYYCINLYVGNIDVSMSKNTASWRTIKKEEGMYGDGKWRWMLFDMDDSLRSFGDIDWLEKSSLMNDPFMQSLLDNERFRKQFCITFMDIANVNYAYDTVHRKLPEWENIYREQVVKTHQCFVGEDFDEETFHSYIMEIDDYFKNRFSYAMDCLAYAFGLTGKLETITVEKLDSEKGTVTINTAELDGLEEWSGQYFTDYPITISANPKEGYRFVGWNGDMESEESTVEVYLPEGGLRVEAVFEKVS